MSCIIVFHILWIPCKFIKIKVQFKTFLFESLMRKRIEKFLYSQNCKFCKNSLNKVRYNQFYYQNKGMKDKFSIFSPTANKNEGLTSPINFKKSPNKFAIYEPSNKPKEMTKYPAYQSLSSANLDNIKKLPNEYSNLRQTLSYKTTDFQAWGHDDESEGVQKQSNFLRQTLNNKPIFKPRGERNFSESFSGFEHQHSNDPYLKNNQTKGESQGVLGYSKIHEQFLNQLKPSQRVQYLKMPQRKTYQPQRFEDKFAKTKEESFKSKLDQSYKSSSNLQKPNESQYYISKKASQKSVYEQIPKSPTVERKFSQSTSYVSNTPQSEETIFRKKARERDQFAQQCYTPKLPKYSYEDRFKKVGSPTSTDNSDSRSPPNKCIQVPDLKKKGAKISIEDFAVGKMLGEGKFGQVLVARHKKNGFLIALKKIPKAMIKSHYMIQQLTLEIRLQSCINHKNILGMYGFFDDSVNFYIVLEYMDQGTLYSQLKKNRILTEKQSAMIIKQMTQAVEYLHDQEIAHRDIKPQNIVISNNVYKLCDFGWATLCDERRKTYCGTFDYAAPQILQGKQYDMSVDLWCLGVLTFELLTGKAPFYHISRKETMKKILNVEIQSINYPQSMSRQAVDFIERLIRKDPDQRMKSSEALKHPFLQHIEQN